jgi:hypothetical protein
MDNLENIWIFAERYQQTSEMSPGKKIDFADFTPKTIEETGI